MTAASRVEAGSSFSFYRVLQSCLVLLAWYGCLFDAVAENDRISDAYAGKTGKDPVFFQQMITGRLSNAPRIGELAPDFSLVEVESRKGIQLSQLCRTKPVVLWFGSSTCGETHRSIEPLTKLARRYKDKVQFVFVYIREAHPKDGLAFGPVSNIDDPKTYEERCSVAAEWKKRMNISIPIVVDGIGDPLAVRWAAWPVRLYVVDRKQRIVYAGQQGPWYYNPGKWYKHEGRTNLVREKDWDGISRVSLEDFLSKYQVRSE